MIHTTPTSGPGLARLGWRRMLLGHRREIALFVLLLCCYAYFFPRWADWNQNSRLDLVLAIVDDHSVRIDAYVANTGDYASYGGHYYSDKAPGMALLGVPVYAILRTVVPMEQYSRLGGAVDGNRAFAGTLRVGGAGLQSGSIGFFVALVTVALVCVAIPAALLGVLVARLACQLGLGERAALFTAALYGLATCAFPYANAFVGHQTSAFLLFAAFTVTFAIRREAIGQTWLLAVGFLLGYAVITEYQTGLIGAVIGLYALLTLRRPITTGLRLAAGAVPPILLLAGYDWLAFGTLLPVGYFHSALWTDVHQVGLVSLTYPQLDALWGITFGSHRGLFYLSPYLLLAGVGYRELWRVPNRRPECWVLALAPLSFLLFNASSAMWQGGFAVGPRYLVASLPFLGLAAGVGAARVWRLVALRPLVTLAVIWSWLAIWAETIGGQAFPDYTPNPLPDYSLPKLLVGDIARNAGMLFGLSGWASLAPILVAGLLLAALMLWPRRAGSNSTVNDPQRAAPHVRWASL